MFQLHNHFLLSDNLIFTKTLYSVITTTKTNDYYNPVMVISCYLLIFIIEQCIFVCLRLVYTFLAARYQPNTPCSGTEYLAASAIFGSVRVSPASHCGHCACLIVVRTFPTSSYTSTNAILNCRSPVELN